MPPRAALPVLAALLGLCVTEASAWTDPTRLRMLDDALRIAPPALGQILRHHEASLRRGMLDPSAREEEEIHFQHPDGQHGLAATAIDRKRKEIAQLLKDRKPLKRFAYEMGVLAHLVADVEFPLNASDADPREPLYREGWRRYIERQLAKIPFVIDREPPAHLEKQDYRGFVMTAARRAAENYALIGPAFKDDGTPKSPQAVDERSVPFGIASLSYSHAASSIAWVWLGVWRSVNGDLEGTPALNLPPPEKASIPPRPPRPRGSGKSGDAAAPAGDGTKAAPPSGKPPAAPAPSRDPAAGTEGGGG